MKRELRKKDFKQDTDYTSGIGVTVENEEEANVVSSKVHGSDLHMPVIDLDVPHRYVPSSTPGHGHLYIDKPMTFDDYMEILLVLTKHGVVEDGYYNATNDRGMGLLRLKTKAED